MENSLPSPGFLRNVNIGGSGVEDKDVNTESLPEALRASMYERYTIPRESLNYDIKEAKKYLDIPLLRETSFDTLSLASGLRWGKEAAGYNYLDNKDVAANLMNIFTTKEGSMARPDQSDLAELIRTMKDAVDFNGIEIAKYKSNPQKWAKRSLRKKGRELKAYSQIRKIKDKTPPHKEVLTPYTEDEIAELKKTHLTQEIIRMNKEVAVSDELHALSLYIDARKQQDTSYLYRQNTSKVGESEDKQLRSGGVPELDKAERQIFYRYDDKLGEAQSNIERAIIDIGTGVTQLPDLKPNPDETRRTGRQLFTEGFRTVEDFKVLLTELLKYSEVRDEKRMDAVLLAWQETLLNGTISRLAWSVKTNKDTNDRVVSAKYVFGAPPVISDLDTTMIHYGKNTLSELGVSALDIEGNIFDPDAQEFVTFNDNGEKIVKISAEYEEGSRVKVGYAKYEEHVEMNYLRHLKRLKTKAMNKDGEKDEDEIPVPPNLSHVGSVLTIARFVRLYDDYMHHTTLKSWDDPRPNGEEHKNEISLHKIFYDLEMNKANKDFPWIDTEARGLNTDTEVPSGSVGVYNLRRIRASIIMKALLRPEQKLTLTDLTYDKLTSITFRTAGKIGLVRPGPLVNGRPQNPLVWLVSGVFVNGSMNLRKDSVYIKGERGLDHAPTDKVGKATGAEAGLDTQTYTEHDVLNNLEALKLMSSEEVQWIKNKILAEPNVTRYEYEQISKGKTFEERNIHKRVQKLFTKDQ